MEVARWLLCAKIEEKERGVGSGHGALRGGVGVDVRSAREVRVQCQQGHGRGRGGVRSEEKQGSRVTRVGRTWRTWSG
jgi:hypothetical protein